MRRRRFIPDHAGAVATTVPPERVSATAKDAREGPAPKPCNRLGGAIRLHGAYYQPSQDLTVGGKPPSRCAAAVSTSEAAIEQNPFQPRPHVAV